ncbi:MAG: hypothetical protein EOO43_05410 [Flavobacterium sp.]|nr:MAG: hypothetical protein EOO43_05410 [Flavobacterium sp.]
MSEIKQSPVLEFIIEKIKGEIADAKVEKQSEKKSVLKDGNDSILLEETAGLDDHKVSVLITDKKEILYSEDLLEILQDIHLEARPDTSIYESLKSTNIIVNGLSIETKFIFQAVKEFFDTLSNSYQFLKTVEKSTNQLTMEFQFGDTKFHLLVSNGEHITVNAKYDESVNAKIKTTIADDVIKVQQALNKMFKD